jgi:DoxX
MCVNSEKLVRQAMRKILAVGRKAYEHFVKAMSSTQSLFLLAVRLYWGWQLAQNGWGKLHNLANVTEFFAGLGLPVPGPAAVFVASFELWVRFCLPPDFSPGSWLSESWWIC